MRPITASDVMNPEVLTVTEDMSVSELAAFLIDHEITGAPVVDRNGRLVGVVSMVDIVDVASQGAPSPTPSDFFERAWEEGPSDEEVEEIEELPIEEESLLVEDIMSTDICSVPEDARVSEIASLMLQQHLHRVLVQREEKLVGIISSSDLLGLLVDEH
jgi:CBS domain-containing protein